MSLILVIEDDSAVSEAFARLLTLRGHLVTTARTGARALRLLRKIRFECVVCDLALPDISGLDLLRRVGSAVYRPGFVLVSGVGTMADGAAAVQLGANAVLQKPVSSSDLLAAIDRGLASVSKSQVSHASERWCAAVICAVESHDDPATLLKWSKRAAVSRGALRNWCRTASLSPKRSLGLARSLRAWLLRVDTGLPFPEAFDAADLRTVRRLLREAGLSSTLPDGIEEFLAGQEFIQHAAALNSLKAAFEKIKRPMAKTVQA